MADYRELIKKKREEKGLSQSELARQVGISQAYMNQIERGVRNPTLPTLMKICELLEIPMFGGSESNE